MIVKKVFNNNAICAIENEQEIVLTGPGIGFGVERGDIVDTSKIEKKFYVAPNEKTKYAKFFTEIPYEYFQIADEILQYAKEILNRQLEEKVLMNLADHIFFARQRYLSNQHLSFVLLDELSMIYPKEYRIGKEALNIIAKHTSTLLPDYEIGFIAFHIIIGKNSEEDNNPQKLLAVVSEISDVIIKEFKGVKIRKDDESYHRLVIHLKYLVYRLFNNNRLTEDVSEIRNVFKSNKNLNRSIAKVSYIIEKKLGFILNEQEELYLMIHISRIINNQREILKGEQQ